MLTGEALDAIKRERVSYLWSELERVKNALILEGASKIILFGSAARGELGLFSDIDLIAVMPSKLPYVERMTKIYRKLHPGGMDLLVYTPAEFRRMSRTNPFVRSAIREGKILYESRLCTNRGCSRSALRSGGGRTDAADGVIHEVVWTEGGKRKPRWFRQAEEDLKSAEILFESGRFYMVCFVAQQIAEKAVKSFLYYKGREIVLGHSLEQLCREAARFDRKFEALRGEVSILDNFYIPARYPNGLPDSIPALVFNKKTAGEALRLARKTLETVRGKIGPLQES